MVFRQDDLIGMTQNEFWALIAEAGSGTDPYDQAAAIQTALSQRSAADVLDFERHLAAALAESYTWSLWGAAYLINGGCSDDGFDDFRGWLLLQGRPVFERAIRDPDSLADLPHLSADVECEDILYVARGAYEVVSGSEMPDVSVELPDLGEGWDFDDEQQMRQRYPRLFERFG